MNEWFRDMEAEVTGYRITTAPLQALRGLHEQTKVKNDSEEEEEDFKNTFCTVKVHLAQCLIIVFFSFYDVVVCQQNTFSALVQI